MSTKNSKQTVRRGRGCGCHPGCSLFLLAVVLVGGILHFVGQSRIHKAITEAYPPPGEMLDVDGLQMHIYCIGQGDRTIVIETGMSYTRPAWADIQEKLARQARVCVYDRAGRGWSQSSWSSRSAGNITAELHALLQKAGIEPGFILLGERESAVYVRHYAQSYPGEVAGLVLVDDPWSAPSVVVMPATYGMSAITLLLIPMRTIPWWWQGEAIINQYQWNCPTGMDEPDCQRWRVLLNDPLDGQTAALEGFGIPTAMIQSHAPEINFGDIPLLVVRSPSSDLNASDLNSVFADLIARSSAGKLLLCPEGDGPLIGRDPDCIVDAVRSLLR